MDTIVTPKQIIYWPKIVTSSRRRTITWKTRLDNSFNGYAVYGSGSGIFGSAWKPGYNPEKSCFISLCC